jgi:cellulose biosynthesis protein BcsQ
MLAELKRSVLVVDLDPQANLTAGFLAESELEKLWDHPSAEAAGTIFQCVEPLTQVGDVRPPDLLRIPRDEPVQPSLFPVTPEMSLLPGDLALSGFEDDLSAEWPNCLRSDNLYRPFRVVTAFWQVMQVGAQQCEADLILVDVGPSLGAINRSALIATDYVVVPLAADLFSRQGLRNLGPTLTRWREEWQRRRENWKDPAFELPSGEMQPLGYLIQQPSIRLKRPVEAYDRWARRMPAEYAESVLGDTSALPPLWPDDPNLIATVKHYRSLVPLGHDALKPIFHLAAADGARGSHAAAARDAGRDFERLAKNIVNRMEISLEESQSGSKVGEGLS